MIKDCKVILNNERVTVIDFDGTAVQLPSIHRKAEYIKVKFDNDRHIVLPDDYTEIKTKEEDEVVIEQKPKNKRNKKTTNENANKQTAEVSCI